MTIIIEEYAGHSTEVLSTTDRLFTANVVKEINEQIACSAATNFILKLDSIDQLASGSLYPEAEPLGPLILLQKRMNVDAKRIILCDLRDNLKEVFKITRLYRVFDIQANVQDALARLAELRSE